MNTSLYPIVIHQLLREMVIEYDVWYSYPLQDRHNGFVTYVIYC